jgi:gamma-glutamyltranspeptidase
VFELPPPGQGFAALEMLNILEVCVPKLGYNLTDLGPSDPMKWHLLVEAKKLAYSDLLAKNADPKFAPVPVKQLISKEHAATLCGKINPNQAGKPGVAGGTEGGTIYLTTAIAGATWCRSCTACSASTAAAPRCRRTGFILHNRGSAFSLDPEEPEHRRAAQAAVPLDHRRLRDEERRADDDVRQHGRQRAAGNARAAHGQPDRSRHERADDDGLRRASRTTRIRISCR